jgi:bifunctional N-acetylglucosamine-1-phosphate-uridyltransferase/glucosamine-1-phosphate-acetyltransferase GlmU-like protein
LQKDFFSIMKSAASIIFAAGKGSRMTGYEGNKTLLPLIPFGSLYEGEYPLLHHVLHSLPPGPKGIVVHHCSEDVRRATEALGVSYIFQETTNGTGGALLASRPFLEAEGEECVIITMGDVPLIRGTTYRRIVESLELHSMVVLASMPENKGQYGMLEMDGTRVVRIVEWKYWREFSAERMAALKYCNGGVYAVRRSVLLPYIDRLSKQPHHVRKQRGDLWVTVEEYFLTDLVELMSGDGLSVGMLPAPEEEVMGVDNPESLKRAQEAFAQFRTAENNAPSAM